MFYSLVLRFFLEKDIAFTHHLGRALHGMFFSLLKRCDASYASWLHNSTTHRPFTVSPITAWKLPETGGPFSMLAFKQDRQSSPEKPAARVSFNGYPLDGDKEFNPFKPDPDQAGPGNMPGHSPKSVYPGRPLNLMGTPGLLEGATPAGPPLLAAGGLYRVRFTILQDRPFLKLSEYFLGIRKGVRLFLAGAPVSVKEVLITPTAADPWPGHADPAELLARAQGVNAITLFFASPTTFRRGDINLPLPVPRLVFQSLYEKWQHFCPHLPLKEDLLDFIDQNLFPAEYDLQTNMVNFGKNAMYVGFTGRCTFGLKQRTIQTYPEHARQVDLLASFAFYAGVGQKTTMGMGQCFKKAAE